MGETVGSLCSVGTGLNILTCSVLYDIGLLTFVITLCE